MGGVRVAIANIGLSSMQEQRVVRPLHVSLLGLRLNRLWSSWQLRQLFALPVLPLLRQIRTVACSHSRACLRVSGRPTSTGSGSSRKQRTVLRPLRTDV